MFSLHTLSTLLRKVYLRRTDSSLVYFFTRLVVISHFTYNLGVNLYVAMIWVSLFLNIVFFKCSYTSFPLCSCDNHPHMVPCTETFSGPLKIIYFVCWLDGGSLHWIHKCVLFLWYVNVCVYVCVLNKSLQTSLT